VEGLPVASLSVPKSSVAISRNYDFDFSGSDGKSDSSPPYRICKPASVLAGMPYLLTDP
jgi:uridine phosphorylase